VGNVGICVLTGSDGEEEQEMPRGEHGQAMDVDQMVCWGRAKDVMPPAAREGWDQVALGCCGGCAVSLESHLDCWGYSLPSRLSQQLRDFVVA